MLNPSLDYVGTRIRVKVNGDSLKQEKITFNHGETVNIYIVYEIEKGKLFVWCSQSNKTC